MPVAVRHTARTQQAKAPSRTCCAAAPRKKLCPVRRARRKPSRIEVARVGWGKGWGSGPSRIRGARASGSRGPSGAGARGSRWPRGPWAAELGASGGLGLGSTSGRGEGPGCLRQGLGSEGPQREARGLLGSSCGLGTVVGVWGVGGRCYGWSWGPVRLGRLEGPATGHDPSGRVQTEGAQEPLRGQNASQVSRTHIFVAEMRADLRQRSAQPCTS